MDEKQLKILLMFGADAGKANAELKQLNEKFVSLSRRAEELRASLKMFRELGQDTKSAERELQAVEAEMNRVADAARKAVAEVKGMAQGARDVRDNLYQLRDIGEKLSQVGQYVGGVGNAILSPLAQASQLFLSTAAQSDPLVMRWKSEMSEIQDAWLRIGRVATQELLPLLEDASNFMDALADFVEAHPELIKIAIGAGAGLKVTGEILQSLGSIAMLAGTLKQLGLAGAGGWLAGAGKAVGAFATGTGGAITGGIGLGLAGYEAIAQSEWGQKQGLANLGQFASVGAYGLGKLFGGEEMGQEWFRWMGELTGVIEKQAEAAQQDAQSMETVTQAQLDAFAAWEDAQNKRKQYEQQSEEARNAIVAEFGARRAEIEQSYESQRGQIIAQYAEQRAKAISAFALSEQRTEQDYYRQRREAARRHGLEVRRAEEDHQREMRKLQRDHNRRVRDLVDERDALGLVREQQAYEDQRQEAEENYRVEMRRRNEDYAMQLRDMETNFALQRQRRLEDFQRQQQELAAQQQARLAQLDNQHALELQKLAEQEKTRLEQYDKNYKAELEQLQAAEQQRLNVLRSLALNDQSALQRAGMELTARYRAWLQQAAQSFLTPIPSSGGGGGSIGRRASGGWVNAGAPYWVGERGPELLIPHTSGNIIPTHRILSNERGETTRADSSGVNMRIETSSLTLAQVIREIDKRLARNNRALAEAFA